VRGNVWSSVNARPSNSHETHPAPQGQKFGLATGLEVVRYSLGVLWGYTLGYVSSSLVFLFVLDCMIVFVNLNKFMLIGAWKPIG
jgi:hypothetical protein